MEDNLLENLIKFQKLKRINVEGGDVLHILKSNEESFKSFGEAYFTFIESGFIKAWKKHTKMTMNLVVPEGKVRFVFYCEVKNKFLIYDIGKDNYGRITVPPNYWFGFKGLSKEKSLIINISNIIHAEEEVKRLDLKSINFKW